MNRNELTDHIAFQERHLAFLRQIKTDCTDCEHFDRGYCRKHQGNPPQEFVSQGCDDWSFDDVPF